MTRDRLSSDLEVVQSGGELVLVVGIGFNIHFVVVTTVGSRLTCFQLLCICLLIWINDVARCLVVNSQVKRLPINMINILVVNNHWLALTTGCVHLRLTRRNIVWHAVDELHILRVHLVNAVVIALVHRVWHLPLVSVDLLNDVGTLQFLVANSTCILGQVVSDILNPGVNAFVCLILRLRNAITAIDLLVFPS